MLRFLFSVFILAAVLCFRLPAYASEDPDSFEVSDDFSFDDLPDIVPLPLETQTPLAPETGSVSKAAVSTEDSNMSRDPESDKTSKGSIYIPGVTDTDTEEDAFDSTKSLTETLKEDAQQQGNSPLEGTLVEKLTTTNPLSLLSSDDTTDDEESSDLEKMVQKARGEETKGRSNASVFDIAGVMLRMSLDQTERTLQNRGFRKINAKFQIPNFIKWRYDETCRNEGVVGYERLEACVINKAKKGGYEYLQYLKYAKFDSKEEIEIYFTSNFTENKVYKIVYRSRIASITGNSPKAIYIRNIKVYDFWKRINQKYGQPDDKSTVIWGLGGDKPYLKADTGYLLLEDPMFRELDYTRMSREDQRFINSDFYNF